jgi:AraC-like DNA-binding protein
MKLSIFNIHDVALFVTLALSLFLAMLQFFYPNKNKVEKYFLTTLLIDIAIGIASVLMLWQPAIKIHPLVDSYLIPYVLFCSLLLKGPLLYGYVCAVTTHHFRLRPVYFFHLTPLLFYFVALGLNLFNHGNGDSRSDKLTWSLSVYEWHSVKIIPVVYALLALHKVQQYLHHQSKPAPDISLGNHWLVILVWGTVFNWGWSLLTHILGIWLGASVADKFGIFDNYITSALISALFVYSLVHINKQLSNTLNSPLPPYEINAEKHIIAKIIHCMEVEKLFLNPRLNIDRLAEHINLPYREVSTLINKHFHLNFNEYVNLYRINEAKRLLSDSQLLNVPINEIYVQAGFNSKSAFHRFFSRLVGVSPTEFRKLSSASTKASFTSV